MLLWLTEYLSQYIGGFSVFQYLTLRTMVSVITALAVSLMMENNFTLAMMSTGTEKLVGSTCKESLLK